MRQAAANTAAPSASTWSLIVMPPGCRPKSFADCALRSLNGLGRRSSPTIVLHKVERIQNASARRRSPWSASNTAMPSGPQTTASPSGERAGAQLAGGLGDHRIARGPIVAAAGEQAHRSAVAPDDQPIAVMLDFIVPSWDRKAGPARATECRIRQSRQGG